MDVRGEALALAADCVRAGGDLVVVGSGGGQLVVGKGRLPAGAPVSLPFWGTRPELREVLALAEAGRFSYRKESDERHAWQGWPW